MKGKYNILLYFSILSLTCSLYSQYHNYVWERETIRGISSSADRLKEKLEKEVIEMMDTGNPVIDGGYLHPAYYRVGIICGFLLYGCPAETVYVLSDIYPFLSYETKQRLKNYIKGFMQVYPPLTRGYIHGDTTWGPKKLEGLGNRREYYPMAKDTVANIWPPPVPPLETIYALWRYADVTGDWQYINEHIQEIINVYNTYSGPAYRYGEIMGLIGMARIAHKMNNIALRDDAENKANTAMANSNYTVWLSSAEGSFIRWLHDWCYAPFHVTRNTPDSMTSGVVIVFFCPELGRFIHDKQYSSAEPSISLRIGHNPIDHAKATYPGWFAYRADYCYGEYIYKNVPGWEQNFQGGENSYNTPDFSWTFFMLRAYVMGDGPGDLEKFVDMPTCTGDLCYMQKLATAIKAYGTREWSDIRFETQDITAPQAVTDLRIISNTENSIILTWTATGDDGLSGTAWEYDIRYSLEDLTDINKFNSAIQCAGEPSPKTSGAIEVFEVIGLSPGSTYYFRMKVIDDAGNLSELSNMITGFTGGVAITPEIKVIYPDGGEILYAGTNIPDRWTSKGAVGRNDILISLDNGINWEVLKQGTPDDGYEIVTLPNRITDCGLIKIQGRQVTVSDLSDSVFSINAGLNTPVLSVSENILMFDLKPGEKKTSIIKIINSGTGNLSGSISKNAVWVSVSPEVFSGNENEILITVDNNILKKREGQYTAEITVNSNGGTVIIPVIITATCVLAKPNPYNPEKGNLIFYGSGIVQGKTEIDIFAISGEFVKRCSFSKDIYFWDGKDAEGKIVTPGIYIYTYNTPKEKGTGKITVVRNKD